MNPESQPSNRFRYILRSVIGIVLLIVIALAIWHGWLYTKTLPNLRRPQSAHYHLRLQIINNSQSVDFASDNFQTPYDKYNCSVDLPKEPIHFHDNISQFVHIHWRGITGGMVLKQYGWNEIGGKDHILGYRLDESWWPQAITTHGNVLPQKSNTVNYYLYTGDQTSHQLRNWQEFLHQDLEVFFNSKNESNTSHASSTATGSKKIEKILGNAVLFAQDQQPNDAEVQIYFNNLTPPPESTCGG